MRTHKGFLIMRVKIPNSAPLSERGSGHLGCQSRIFKLFNINALIRTKNKEDFKNSKQFKMENGMILTPLAGDVHPRPDYSQGMVQKSVT